MSTFSWSKIIFSTLTLLNIFNTTNIAAEQRLYWADSNFSNPAIRCVDSNLNSCIDSVNLSNTVLFNFNPGDYIGGIALDEKNQKIIFTNSGNPGRIQKVNMDGSGSIETIVTNAGDTPTHIAFDPITENIYWTSFDGMYRGNINSDSKTLVNTITAYSFQGVAIDNSLNRLIWMEGFSSSVKTIYYADLGNLTPNMLTTIPMADSYGLGIDESLSPLTKILWAPYESSISAQLSYYEGYATGQSVDNLINSLSGPDYFSYSTIAVNFPETHIYFANKIERKIYRSSLIPANAAQGIYLSNAGEVTGMAFDCGKYAPDTDLDKIANCRDLCPADANKSISTGACGCGVAETDSDGDSIPDCVDTCDNRIDTDGDGVPDCTDTCDGRVDTDKDGTPDCFETCDNNPLKTEPDTCPCETLSDTNSDGVAVCVTTRQLAPNTKIESPPLVTVEDNIVTLILEKFSKPTLTLKKKKKKKSKDVMTSSIFTFSNKDKTSGLKVSYEIQITQTDAAKRNVKKLTAKRNQLTLKNLAPGNYSVKYKAVINQNGKPAAKTDFSPDATFSIG